MRVTLLAIGLILIAAPAAAADAVQGEWITAKGGAKVRIGPCPSDARRMCGAVSWLQPAQAGAKDVRNPEPTLKSRPMLGMPVLWGLRQAGPGRWTGGKVYAANTGKTYDAALAVAPDGTLKVEACLLSLACRTQSWRRD